MKKFIFILFLLFSFTACARNTENGNQAQTVETSREIESTPTPEPTQASAPTPTSHDENSGDLSPAADFQENHVSDDTVNGNEEIVYYTPEFRIWTINDTNVDYKWRYEIIGYDGDVVASDISVWYMPRISLLNHRSHIVKIEIGCGSPCAYVQYVNLRNGDISSSFFRVSWLLDYVVPYHRTDNTATAILAYYSYDEQPVVVIRNIFNDDFYLEIDEGFAHLLGGINTAMFLDENKLYIDYDKEISDGNFINRQVVFVFDHEGYSCIELN